MVLLEVVDACLLIIAHIAYTQEGAAPSFPWSQVNGEHVHERWCGGNGCEHDVVVVVAFAEYLVV